MADTSSYKVGLVLSVDDKSSKGGKTLKACSVDIGNEEPVTVVTAASNVREGSRIVIAPVGSTIINDEGEEQTLTKATVGGIPSEGMFCDARMLGWGSGSAGIAAQVPDSFNPGDAPPKTKPGAPGSKSEEASVPSVEVQGLFEKKLSKEEKKALAAKKREEKRKAKEAAAEGDS
mmetsp:Transcript_15559/g.33616  ORF Transcript_15559/g.33616 Transcript_15559/m.33616 type:complete len:175 (-) Transcript_15559:1420-1944(-)